MEQSWKQYPNLFANGEFSGKQDGNISQITGIANLSSGTQMFITPEQFLNVEECTLIARKIEDISFNECFSLTKTMMQDGEFNIRWIKTVDIEDIHELLKSYSKNIDVFLWLLSIGVCPPQFWDDSVIDINEVEK